MADPATIKRIGYRQAFKATTAGLMIAYLIMALMAGPFWLFQVDYAKSIIFATVIIYIAGYYFGGLTACWIIKEKRPAIIFGITGGFLIVWSATFIGSLVGLEQQGLSNKTEIGQSFHDYVFKPMAVVTMFGFLPIVLVGRWFGLSVKKYGNKISDKSDPGKQ